MVCGIIVASPQRLESTTRRIKVPATHITSLQRHPHGLLSLLVALLHHGRRRNRAVRLAELRTRALVSSSKDRRRLFRLPQECPETCTGDGERERALSVSLSGSRSTPLQGKGRPAIALSPFFPGIGIPDGFVLDALLSFAAEPFRLANTSLAAPFAGAHSLLPIGHGGLRLDGTGHTAGATPRDELLLDPPARGGV